MATYTDTYLNLNFKTGLLKHKTGLMKHKTGFDINMYVLQIDMQNCTY